MTNHTPNEDDTMAWFDDLTKELFDKLNAHGVQATLVTLKRPGRVSTIKTNNFRTVAEYIEMWEAAIIQDQVSLWKR